MKSSCVVGNTSSGDTLRQPALPCRRVSPTVSRIVQLSSVADEKNHQSPTDEEIHPDSPKISFPEEDLVDIQCTELLLYMHNILETVADITS